LPTRAGDAIAAVVYDVERTEFGDFFRQEDSGLRAGLVRAAVALAAQPQEVVVLAGDLPAWPRKVEREGGHIPAQIVHAKHQIRGQFLLVAPDHPTAAQR